MGALKPYLQWPQWQLPLFALLVVGWLIGGGYLIHRLYSPHVSRQQRGLGRGILASLLGGGAGLFAVGACLMLFKSIGTWLDAKLTVPGLLVGGVAGAGMFLIVLYALYAISPRQVFGRGAIVLAALLLFGGGVGAGIFLPARPMYLQQVRRSLSRDRLASIEQSIQIYIGRHAMPPDTLEDLVADGLLSKDFLRSPADREPRRSVGYFILPRTPLVRDNETPILRGAELSHEDTSVGRVVSYANTEVVWLQAAEFEEVLSRSENRRFAEAFRKADAEQK